MADLTPRQIALCVAGAAVVLVLGLGRLGGGSGAGGAAGIAPEPAEGQPLNLNTATLEQLDTLSGVGPATAQKILDARAERGGFGSIEELGEIPGIGDARLATLREEATV